LGKQAYGGVLSETLGSGLSDGSLQIDEVCRIAEDRALVRFCNGTLIENFVGALNPLRFEMLFASQISPKVLGQPSRFDR
jgi:hypothetical protein